MLRQTLNINQLVNENLNEMDDLVHSTVLDPSMGGGQFMKEVERRKREAGLSDKMIAKTCFGFCDDIMDLNYIKNKFKLVGQYKVGNILEEDVGMKFGRVLGNPPYQYKQNADKKGRGGDNSLYIKFIHKSIDLLEDGGVLSFITPPAALIKSTIYGEPTETLKKMMAVGSLESIDMTAKQHFNVGTHIAHWVFVKGKKQGDVILTREDGSVHKLHVSDIYYMPPMFEDVEFNLYKKIVNNKTGDILTIRRVDGKNVDKSNYTMARFGYPKIQKVADLDAPLSLAFDDRYAAFMTSQLGLWLLDYVRRHDQMIYHLLLTGIRIPPSGFKLNKAEREFVNSRTWCNFGKSEEK